MRRSFQVGDLVVYRKSKTSTHPGPRAANVHPARHGDAYSYTVDKFCVIEELLDDGTIVASTRRGKKNQIKPDDPMLRKANLLQKLLYRTRFAALDCPAPASNDQLPAANH